MEGGEDPYVSLGAGAALHNPEVRKGLTLDFDKLKHPLFGSLDRGFKLWYTFWVIAMFWNQLYSKKRTPQENRPADIISLDFS